MAESEVLDPADIGIVAAGLASGSVGVRAATLQALSRLPLTAPDWRAVGRYAHRVLAGGGSAAERQVVIEASPSIPLRSVRDRVAGFVDSADPELSWRAAAAVRAMGHASTVPAILALPAGDSGLYRIALTDISGAVAAVRAEFGARAAGSEDRFWLALALALSGEDAELRAIVELLAQPQRPDWYGRMDYQLREVMAARRLPEPTARWLAEPAAPIPADLVTALTVRPDLARSYPHRVGTALRPGWSDGRNPGFSTRRDPDENEVREADELYTWISGTYLRAWRSEETTEELAARVRSVESHPVIVSRLMERASVASVGRHSIWESNNIVTLVGMAQGRFRPDVAGLFETYREVMTRSWRERTAGFDEASVSFGSYDDEGGPRSFCLQIGWIVSRGGLPGLVPALAAHLRSADPRTRIAATYLIADAAAYVTEAIAPQFGGGSGPDRAAAWELVDESDEDRITRGGHGGVGPVIVHDELEQGLEQRYLNGRFPQVVRLGDVVSLVVRIGVQPAARLSGALAPVAIPLEGVEVVLNLVDHPGFVARSPERVPLTVFRGVDSAPAAFDLEASETGVHALQLEAFLGGTHLGGLHIQTTIEAGATTGETVERSAPVGGRVRDPGEVSLLIHYEPRDTVYRYQLIDWSGDVPDEARSHQLLKTPSEAVEVLVRQLNQVAGGSPWDAKTTFAWLKNQGIALWNGFIPEALKSEFWERRDQISKLTVISSGDPVPWELLYPFDGADHDAGFLVDQFPVARYRFGVRPPNRLRITSADLVLSGTDSLPSVSAEVEAITELLRARNVDTQTLSTVPALLSRFDAAKLGLIHFACHNAFEASAPSASRIMMQGQPFEPVFLEQHAGRFGEAAPLVFMNACRTDGQAPVYTTMEGWASSFLRAGAGAFVGSLWEVRDSSASTYAHEFYRAALSGDTLGEASRKARAAIREEPGDPTWLAYTLYGDTAATII